MSHNLILDQLAQLPQVVVFKHSRTCPSSWMARTELVRFANKNPNIPIHTIIVQEDRELSRSIAAWTGVAHQSPQVIVLRRGQVICAESHEGVTEDFLAGAVRQF